MEQQRINQLIDRFNKNMLTEAEQRELDELIASGTIDYSVLDGVSQMEMRVEALPSPNPSSSMDDRFYQMLALQKKKSSAFDWNTFFSWPQLAPKLAFAFVALICGLLVGYLVRPNPSASSSEMQALTQEVSTLKEMMMLSLLEKESATDRLKAVSLTQDMPTVSEKVTGALIQTLNEDENVNVRLAALDALKPYVRDSAVREQIVRSISKQTSPLVQLALADLMAQLQVKSSAKALEKIIESDGTPAEVKKRIQENLKVLI